LSSKWVWKIWKEDFDQTNLNITEVKIIEIKNDPNLKFEEIIAIRQIRWAILGIKKVAIRQTNSAKQCNSSNYSEKDKSQLSFTLILKTKRIKNQ
jgi:hypothetical protein